MKKSKNDTKLSTLTCSDECKINNKAIVNYDYVIENEINSNSSESNLTSTCIKPTQKNSFTNCSSISQRFAKVGDIVTYSVHVANTGTSTINNLILTSLLDPRTSYLNDPTLLVNGLNKSVTDTTLGQNINLENENPIELLPEECAVFTFKIKVASDENLSAIPNTASINAAFDDGSAFTMPSNETLLELKSVKLDVMKFVSQSEVKCGDPLVYTIKVTNNSLYEARNLIITDYFDREFKFCIDDVSVRDGVDTLITDASIEKIAPNGIKVTLNSLPSESSAIIEIPGTVVCCPRNN